MSEIVYISTEYDYNFFLACIGSLQDYLTSDLRDWPILLTPPVNHPPYPMLTPGSLYLARKRLTPTRLNDNYRRELARLDQKQAEIILHWKTHWLDKVNLDREINRILWNNYILDFIESPWDYVQEYPIQVTQRVILDLLLEIKPDQPVQDFIEILDDSIKPYFVSGHFVWQEDLQPGFSEKRYWFLYGSLSDTTFHN